MIKRTMYLLLILAAILLLPLGGLASLSLMAKRPANLGLTDGRLAPCPASPNCVSTQASDAQHRMEPIAFRSSAAETMAQLKSILAAMPRMRVVTRDENYLYAEATSRLFRFVDDVEFYIDEDAQLIHFRSASRVGHSDLGANRARMQRITAAMQQ
jgi:uncharacterized protein (DUF1499 family)